MSARPETTLTATAYGLTVALKVGEGALAGVLAQLPHWWHDSAAVDPPDRTWTIASDAFPSSAEATVSELELWVAEHAHGLIFLHSGVVAIDGRALLLPGRSLAGKTTLTAALLRAGAAYGSDEYAPLRPDGFVEAYPRPLWVRPIGGGDRRRVTAESLGSEPFTGAIPVAGIALLQYDASAGWAVDAISPGTGVLGMVDNCVPARTRPEAMLDVLTKVAGSARNWKGTRGDADEAARALIERLTSISEADVMGPTVPRGRV